MESEIFSTIDSAGQLIKMAVIWLETFHNQFDVSDRKRYIPMCFHEMSWEMCLSSSQLSLLTRSRVPFLFFRHIHDSVFF